MARCPPPASAHQRVRARARALRESLGRCKYEVTRTARTYQPCCAWTARLKRAGAELDSQIARGEFGPLREWLREKVHTVGSIYASPDELLTKITGEPVSARPFLEYLNAKYSELYQL